MRYSYKSIIISLTTLAFLVVHSPAFAQSRSSGGISNNNLLQANCLGEVERLEDVVSSLDTFYGNLRSCNAQGQVFDGTGCVNLAGIAHEWLPDTTNPTELVLRDGTTELARIPVIRGQDGANATATDCPAGTAPK